MKKKSFLFVLFSIICIPLCFGIVACSKKADPDKLELQTSITITYGQSINIEDFNVKLVHPNGEKEDLQLKSNENPKGFTYETENSSSGSQFTPETPVAGRYIIKINYKDLSALMTIVVNKAEFPDDISLSTQTSVQYITEKPTLEIEGLSMRADVFYDFSRFNSQENQWEFHKRLTSGQIEGCDTSEFFINNGFEVGRYKVFATVDPTNHNYLSKTTNEVEFEVTKASLAGKYYIDVTNISFEYNPGSTTLGDYNIASKITLEKDNRYTGQNLEINGSFAWKNPNTPVEITDDEGEFQTVAFSSKNFTLLNDTDDYEIRVVFQKAHFPYWNVSLALNDELVREYSYLDFQDYYDFSLKVSKSIDQSYIDIPSTFPYELKDSNNNVLTNNRYIPTAHDIDEGAFSISYSIAETANYKGVSGRITLYFTTCVTMNGRECTTLQVALDRALELDSVDTLSTIRLLKDIVEPTKQYTINVDNSLANIKIDLNGYILNVAGFNLQSENNDAQSEKLLFEVANGYLGSYNRAQNNTVELSNNSSAQYSIKYSSWGGLTITITDAHVAGYTSALCGTFGNVGATITITNSEIIATDTLNNSAGLFLASHDLLTANATIFQGYSAAYIKAGNSSFTNCSFVATGLKKDAAYSVDGFVATGAAIVIDNTKGNSTPATVQITGGTTSLTDQSCPSVQEILTDDDGSSTDYTVVTLSNFSTMTGSANKLLKNGVEQTIQASNNTNYTEEEPDPGE